MGELLVFTHYLMQFVDCGHPIYQRLKAVDKTVYLIAQIALALALITP
jgi:hypothetical protein